jgi:hypothetical protein
MTCGNWTRFQLRKRPNMRPLNDSGSGLGARRHVRTGRGGPIGAATMSLLWSLTACNNTIPGMKDHEHRYRPLGIGALQCLKSFKEPRRGTPVLRVASVEPRRGTRVP